MTDKKQQTAISPTRAEDYPEWYQQVIKAAGMAESSPVRGCMVINPWGYGVWELIQKHLDKRIKETGHENAYFPLLIPLSFMEKEAQHVEGFAKECAVVTHHRLEAGGENGKLIPAGELEEPLIIRPTSETIIGHMYARWVQSYRDLPILINQWANVMRWEMRTRLFLRTSEFLWQEGHTAHASEEEAVDETMKMLEVYREFSENVLAMPVIAGEKTPEERFPGAINTYSIEAMMQDRKALQAGTSHFLGQNFSRSSQIKFLNEKSEECFAWTTSWGVSTRLIGGLIMTHGDDDGLVLPPMIAPKQVVIVPVMHKEEDKSTVLDFAEKLRVEIAASQYKGEPIRVYVDQRDIRGGEKNWQLIKKGVPLRIEVGPRDIAQDQVCLMQRHLGHKEKLFLSPKSLVEKLPQLLDDMQSKLFDKALAFRNENIRQINNISDFRDFFTATNPARPEIHGGFALSPFIPGIKEAEAPLKDLKVSVRCIPLDPSFQKGSGKCIFTGKETNTWAIFAKAY